MTRRNDKRNNRRNRQRNNQPELSPFAQMLFWSNPRQGCRNDCQ